MRVTMTKICRTLATEAFDSYCSHLLWTSHVIRCSSHPAGKSSVKLFSTYQQGQTGEGKVREYFYYIDHNGQLFLHDAKIKNFTSCFKDKKFLQFFISRIRPRVHESAQERYPEFPYVSPCGREISYVQCEDTPIVYTEIISNSDGDSYLSYNGAGDLLKVAFDPSLLWMQVENGRVYYPAPKSELGKGLVKSSLAVEFSKHFLFDNAEQDKAPVAIMWNGRKYHLKQTVEEQK